VPACSHNNLLTSPYHAAAQHVRKRLRTAQIRICELEVRGCGMRTAAKARIRLRRSRPSVTRTSLTPRPTQVRVDAVEEEVCASRARLARAQSERRTAEGLTRSLTEQLATIRRLVLAEAGGSGAGAAVASRRGRHEGVGRKRSRVRESILALADSPRWAESALYLPSPTTPPARR